MTNGSNYNKWKAGKNMKKSSSARIGASAPSAKNNTHSQSVNKCSSARNARANSCHVRRRYLERLGINVPNTNKTCYEKPLKDGCDQEFSGTTHVITPPSSLSDHSSCSQTEPKKSSHKRQRGVSFDDTVSVKPIPNRASYSERTRKYLYSSPEEFRRNFDRNIIEFDYENGDWRNVLEDDYFYTNKFTGEKIHPIHVLRTQQAQIQRHQSPFDTFVEMSRWL